MWEEGCPPNLLNDRSHWQLALRRKGKATGTLVIVHGKELPKDADPRLPQMWRHRVKFDHFGAVRFNDCFHWIWTCMDYSYCLANFSHLEWMYFCPMLIIPLCIPWKELTCFYFYRLGRKGCLYSGETTIELMLWLRLWGLLGKARWFEMWKGAEFGEGQCPEWYGLALYYLQISSYFYPHVEGRDLSIPMCWGGNFWWIMGQFPIFLFSW